MNSTSSRSKVGLVTGAIAAVVALGIGGYVLNRTLGCNALEEDYLNSVSSLRSNASLSGLVSNDSELTAGLDRMERTDLQAIETHLTAIYTQCGDRADRTAARKGSAMVLRS